MTIDLDKNTIVCGDNLDWLTLIPDNSIDLCYIDPPFFSNANYEIVWGNGAEVASFGDKFAGGIQHYIDWMRPRIEQIHRVLKDSGSIFLHCDWHASHRLRCLLDDIFGENNFVNEVIWKYSRWSNVTRNFQKMHDNIYFYAKDKNNYTFNVLMQEYSNIKYIENTIREKKDGKLVRVKDENGNYVKRQKENKGVPMHDVWTDINFIPPTGKERIGYKTQKPIKLIERILECATNENDLVLDCFAGGFTTANACANLNRKFICGDISPVSVQIGADRLLSLCPNTDFEIKGMPRSINSLKKLNEDKFAELVCAVMGWECRKRSEEGGRAAWDGNKNPIEIKNSVGKSDVRELHSRVIADKKKYGAIVGWKFSREAIEYVTELKNEHGVTIELKDAEKILASLILPEERSEKIQKLYEGRKPKFRRDTSYNVPT